jgi:hypothetical protein
MKTLLFISLLSCYLISMNYGRIPRENLSNTHKSGDTIFISRKFGKGYYHAVYIEKNRQSVLYKDLLDFKMDKEDHELYEDNLKGLKKISKSFKNYNLNGLPKKWLPLYKYKKRYYIYYPSEWGEVDRNVLTDSTLVCWGIEGPYPYTIESARKININTYTFTTCSYSTGKERHIKTIIHIINPKTKLAIWEYPDEKSDNRYELYIPRMSASKFDMVVNYCAEVKMSEFMFDNIDYKTLLKATR